MGEIIRLLPVLTLYLCGAQASAAAHALQQERAIPRRVLVLSATASQDRATSRTDVAHELVEMPLNHLGLVARHIDLRHDRPSHVDWRRVRGVVLLLRPDDKLPPWLWPWLVTVVRARGVPVVHLGSLAPLAAPEPARLAGWLEAIGLHAEPNSIFDPVRIKVESAPNRDCSFEARPLASRTHDAPSNRDPRNEVWLTTIDRRNPQDRRTPIVTAHWGGIALDPWAFQVGGQSDDRRWFIDPIEFLGDALGMRGVPAPDPSVLNGRRKFLFHVDGDGFESMSTVERGLDCGRVMLDRVIDAYRLPMTISVIVASLTKDIRPTHPTAAMRSAAEIFERPHVEVASHAVLHPLNWRRRLTKHTPARTVVWYPSLTHYRHDMVAEVRESIRFINDYLVSGDKKCRVMLWSGQANPTEEALLEVGRLGCVNLNGGVYRWDDWYDSIGFVPPFGKQVGKAYQVYCGAANENVFEGFFTTMPIAFGHVDQTIERTGSPRILKPANIYAHFYSVENPARLRALKKLLKRWALDEPTAPVFASEYSSAVRCAMFDCRIEPTAGGWAFHGFDACRTVRIDGEERPINWSASTGVMGARRMLGALFVHLSAPDAELVFAAAGVRQPHIVEANHALSHFRRDARSVRFVSQAFSRREVVVGGIRPGAPLEVKIDAVTRTVRAGADGTFVLRFDKPGRSEVEVRVR